VGGEGRKGWGVNERRKIERENERGHGRQRLKEREGDKKTKARESRESQIGETNELYKKGTGDNKD